MVLSFAAYRQSLDTSLVVGDAFTADLHRYPGPSWRALVGARHEDGVDASRRPAGRRRRRRVRRGRHRARRRAVARPRPGDASSPRRPSPAVAGCSPTTAARSPSPPTRRAWRRCSPRRPAHPVAVTVEWTVDGCVPLTVHLADRALDVGPRADLSFVSAA